MIECAKCGHRNQDGTEFCQNCGTFLGYDGKKLEALPGSVLATVAPGSQGAAEVRVRNKSNMVDQYEIQVTGAPAAWTVAEPRTLSRSPGKEGAAIVRFQPPRSAEVSAGRNPFATKVQSKAPQEISVRQEGVNWHRIRHVEPGGQAVIWLSERQRQVLCLLAEGFDTAQVGRCLYLSERTVKNEIHNVAGRLGLRNRTHAVAYALRHGLI